MQEQDLPVLEVYAESLCMAAEEAGSADDTLGEAYELAALLKSQPDLLLFLDKPAIETEDKKQLLRDAFSGQLTPLMLNLSLMLVDKFRGGLWLDILETYIKQAERACGVHTARVRTARVLNESERQRLTASLEEFTALRLRIEFQEDPDLLGGVYFRCGDTLIDSTLRGALHDLRGRLEAIRID
jgi:F-type H+-transporting ATPase subunit delta